MKRSTYRLTHKVFEVPLLRPSDPKIDVSPCGKTDSSRTPIEISSVLVQEIRPSDENNPKIISTELTATKPISDPTTPAGQGSASEPTIRRPTVRCSVCLPPYGRHYWLDSYGTWRCTQCHPPAAVAMVRDQILVPLGDVGAEPAGQADELALIASSGEFTASGEFPSYARGRWRYYEDRWGRHWERITFAS